MEGRRQPLPPCNVWRQAAENVAESLQRGMRVIVQGRLKQRSYETKEGEKRTVYEIEVDEVGPSLKYATAKVTKTTARRRRRRLRWRQRRTTTRWASASPAAAGAAGGRRWRRRLERPRRLRRAARSEHHRC